MARLVSEAMILGRRRGRPRSVDALIDVVMPWPALDQLDGDDSSSGDLGPYRDLRPAEGAALRCRRSKPMT
jgi:hypothetical protein